MIDLQIYIEGRKVDLFKDETLQINDKIQDSKEFDKIFSTYSNSYNVPASQINNDIFKHYYNFDVNNGFDANVFQNAVIKVNGFDKYEGFIKLQDVKLKDNKPNSYNIFFTSIISLVNQAVKNDTLRDIYNLIELNSFTVPQSIDEYRNLYGSNGITTDFNEADFCKVLLESRPVFFDNINQDFEDENGDQYGRPRNFRSYSIRAMLSKIFHFYGLDVDTSFFEQTPFNELFFYAQPYKTTTGVEDDDFEFFNADYLEAIDFDLQSGSVVIQPNGLINVNELTPLVLKSVFDNTFQNINSQKIIIRDRRRNEILFEQDALAVDVINPVSNITEDGCIASILLQPNRTYDLQFVVVQEDIYIEIGNSVYQANRVASPKRNPFQGFKVLDFLTSLFKMFNLSFYASANGQIKIEPYNDFYSSGNNLDLTNYVDINKSTIKRIDNFQEIDFNYAESESEATKIQSELSNDGFGNLKYKPKNTSSNEDFEVSNKFQLILPEAFKNQTGAVVKYLARNTNEEGEEVLNKALIHFVKTETGDSGYSLVTGQYNRLTNIASNGQSLFYGSEIEVGTGVVNEDSLFINYYRDYILSIFNKRSRLYEVDCYLPADVINNYKLNDNIIINNRSFRIENITIDLTTGKTRLLLNNFPSLGETFISQLQASPLFLDLTDDAQTQNISVTAQGQWFVNVVNNWITPDKFKGVGSGTLVLNVDQNLAPNKRTNLINIYNEQDVKTVDIIQAENIDPSIVAIPELIEPTGDEQTIQIQIEANINYTITSNQTWATPEFAAGNGDLLLNIDITENPSQINTRTAIITLENTIESITETITIVQQEFDVNQLYAFNLGFGSTSSAACGQTTLNEYFVDNIVFADCDKVFVNELRNPAFSGYYSDGNNWVFWDGSNVINRGTCV